MTFFVPALKDISEEVIGVVVSTIIQLNMNFEVSAY